MSCEIGRQEKLDQVSQINVIPVRREAADGCIKILKVYIKSCTITIKALKTISLVSTVSSINPLSKAPGACCSQPTQRQQS